MRYTAEYIKNSEAYAYDNFIEGATISDIIEELTHNANRYGVDYDEIAIFDSDDEEAATISYFKVVNDEGKYKLIELV